jgi:ethanolamine permease
MPAEPNSYTEVSADYFAKRGLRRYAGVASLWALGVGAVISGHYSGWNLGLSAGGWGGFALAALVIAVMYLGLVFCIAEMGAALPHTGGAYSFARASMGPWGGFITGLCENVEYVLTPAVVVSFLATYLAAVFDTPTAWLPAYWVAGYAVFVGLNVWGVELSFRVTVIVTLAALACLAVFWISALPAAEFRRYALNIAAGPDGAAIELTQGNGPLLPFGIKGAFAALPFAVWLFLAIEQLPLAAEESVDPSRDMPRGIIAGLLTLFVSAGLILWLKSVGLARQFQARPLGRTAARRLSRHLRRGNGQDAGAGRLRRADRLLPHHPVRQGTTDLFAVARRLLPALSVDHPSAPQDALCRPAGGLGGGARDHVRAVVRHGRGKRCRRHPGHAAQHGRGGRHALLVFCRP